eukprot:10239873-Ditylum_brightwellii.AAC.1
MHICKCSTTRSINGTIRCFTLSLLLVTWESPSSPHCLKCINDTVKGGEESFWVCKHLGAMALAYLVI